MPPRIPPPRRVLGPSPSLCLLSACASGPASSPAAALRLLLGGRQARHASRLIDTLRNNPGSTRNRKRVGRGPSSGYGKTSGRGHKGTGQRGKVNPWFQGGQTPLIVSLGRKGFENIRAPQMAEVNLDSIQAWINRGRLDPSRPITPRELIRARIAKLMDGVKLLARSGGGAGRKSGTVLRQPIDLVVSRASQAAIAAVEAAGGRVVTRYYTRDSIRRLLSGKSENTALPLPLGPEHVPAALASTRREDGGRLYRLPDPTSRREVEYYRDPSHRGYLAAGLRVGETPSLYHKVPKPIDDTELARLMKIRAVKMKEKRKDRKHDARVF